MITARKHALAMANGGLPDPPPVIEEEEEEFIRPRIPRHPEALCKAQSLMPGSGPGTGS